MKFSVIICAYTEDRWGELLAAVDSVQRQTVLPSEIIVVIDHNPSLFERASSQINNVTVIENQEPRGLSGGRNSGIAAAHGDVLAFMDEDATANPDWLERLGQGYQDSEVLGVGGAIDPLWLAGMPAWFPREFNWVVGCTYLGMPETIAPIRNLIGCNMSLRREVFDAVGGFLSGIGRIGTLPVGCEETELCIRARQHWPGKKFIYDPLAQVRHRVPKARSNFRYFRSRCYSEGISKALVSRLVGSKDGLASERSYTLRVLPQGVLRGFADTVLRRDRAGIGRAFAIVSGLFFTTLGYFSGKISNWVSRSLLRRPDPLAKPEQPREQNLEATFIPARISEIELSQPLPDLPAKPDQNHPGYTRALVLARLHAQPLGFLELRLGEGGLPASEYAGQVWQVYEQKIRQHLSLDGLPDKDARDATDWPVSWSPACQKERDDILANAPLISIIIATHDRTDSLAACLDSILALAYPNFEVVVVDNAPSSNSTADLIQDRTRNQPSIHYVREDIPGLAIAHNRGLQEARASFLAFTDDDVIVDAQWLTEIVRAFRISDQVACVTGMIVPFEMETPAQGWIEQFGGFGKGFDLRLFDRASNADKNPLFPYTAGQFGSGANMAFRTSALKEIGGFDPALGAGTPAMGGDDLASFFDIIAAGYKLVYQPAAIVHHKHRREFSGLVRQSYGYGVGLVAYLTKTLLDRPARILNVLSKLPQVLQHILSPDSPKNRHKRADYPAVLTRIERKGMLRGVPAYLYSRWKHRKLYARSREAIPGSQLSVSTPLVDKLP